MTIRFHEEARSEFIEAFVWYETKKQGLGDRFMNAVDKRLSQILAHPYQYAQKTRTNFREVKVPDFPYLIVYEFFEKESFIHVAAVYHGKRRPGRKYRRP